MKRIGNFLFFNMVYKNGVEEPCAVQLSLITGFSVKMLYDKRAFILIIDYDNEVFVAGDADENIIAFSKAVEDWK